MGPLADWLQLVVVNIGRATPGGRERENQVTQQAEDEQDGQWRPE